MLLDQIKQIATMLVLHKFRQEHSQHNFFSSLALQRVIVGQFLRFFQAKNIDTYILHSKFQRAQAELSKQ